MADQITVSGPVRVQSDTVERVALDLLDRIDHNTSTTVLRDRGYYFSLYNQCLAIVRGRDPDKLQSGG